MTTAEKEQGNNSLSHFPEHLRQRQLQEKGSNGRRTGAKAYEFEGK
jgi:hypothetical protein